MNGKTIAILCAAGGLIAASVILGNRQSSRASAPSGAAPGAALPTPIGKAPGCSDKVSAATQSKDFGHGKLSAALSGQRLLHGSDGEMFLSLELATNDVISKERPPMSLAIVIDHSGSMQGKSLQQAKKAARGLLDQLSEQDSVAIVQYDDHAEVLQAMQRLDVETRDHMHNIIKGIRADGSTNLHGGLTLGRDEVMRNLTKGGVNRVILLSDGKANVGMTDPASLGRVALEASDKGVRLTAVGLGLEYNEDLMEALAENGRGNYYYVQHASDLAAVFSGELKSIQGTVATNAQIVLKPACAGVEIVEVFGYNTKRVGDKVIVPMADIYGGDARKLVVRVRVPAKDIGRKNVVFAELSFDDAQKGGRSTTSLALGVEISNDVAAVEKSVNKDVIAQSLEVESAKVLRQAAHAYKAGNVAGASGLNRAWRKKALGRAAQFDLAPAASGAIMGELDDQDKTINTATPTSARGKGLVKRSKARAREMSKSK